jgi:hypothetical protein
MTARFGNDGGSVTAKHLLRGFDGRCAAGYKSESVTADDPYTRHGMPPDSPPRLGRAPGRRRLLLEWRVRARVPGGLGEDPRPAQRDAALLDRDHRRVVHGRPRRRQLRRRGAEHAGDRAAGAPRVRGPGARGGRVRRRELHDLLRPTPCSRCSSAVSRPSSWGCRSRSSSGPCTTT